MALSSCFILMILVGAAVSDERVVHLEYTGIYRDLDLVVLEINGVGGSLCYNGRNIFITSNKAEIGVILPGGQTVEVHRNLSSNNVNNVDCCCNILAYGVVDTDNTYHAHVEFLETYVELDFPIANETDLTLNVNCHNGELYVISETTVRQYNLNQPAAAAVELTLAPALAYIPKCAASYVDEADHAFLFVSGPGVPGLTIINMTSGVTSIRGFTYGTGGNKYPLHIMCVTIDGSKLYIKAQTVNTPPGEIAHQGLVFTVNIDTALSGSDGSSTSAEDSLLLKFNSFVAHLVSLNGIGVCTDCNAGCEDFNCTDKPGICDEPCGYCSPNIIDACVCRWSDRGGCIYPNAEASDACIGPPLPADASCIVQYPIASRTEGPAVTVLGYSRQHAAVTVGRLAKTGRWPTSALPNPRSPILDSNTAATGPKYGGFSAAVPGLARGRRFGMFFARFGQTDPMYRNETIPCLSTENSGFSNKYYTYTLNKGDDVTFEAKFTDKLLKFLPEVVWMFTKAGGSYTLQSSLPACKGMLNCTITGVTSQSVGVYEVYRARRYLRLWHPFFYLHVRECPANVCEGRCRDACPSCKQGLCDVQTCTCICEPGWTGRLCDTPCPAGTIGQECGITCAGHFTGNTNCQDLLICLPGDAGCSCYSGLQSPECTEECETGTWGPNCRNDCIGGPCNARTGVTIA